MEEEHKKIRAERRAILGDDTEHQHMNLGKKWTATLNEYFDINFPDIPAHIVCLMLVDLKTCRAAKPFTYRQDDFDDAYNYLHFAQECDPKNPDMKTGQSMKRELQLLKDVVDELDPKN